MQTWSRSRIGPRALIPLCAVLVLGACKDAPTGPRMVQQGAGGEEWVAMTLPAGLPSLATWLPYLESDRQGHAKLEVVHRLRRDAALEREAGRYGAASALTRDATRAALGSIAKPPDPLVLVQAVAALRVWSERVRLDVPLDRHPELAASWQAVESAREAAEAALLEGDTLAAVHAIGAAAERIVEHSPAAVVLRVVERAEARLAANDLPVPQRERAAHLLGTARQEMHVGDHVRALRRALYALQIADGNGVAGPADVAHDCPAKECGAVEVSP